jgi:hypothetical protein
MNKIALLSCESWDEVREDQTFEKVDRLHRHKLESLMHDLSDLQNHEAFEPIALAIRHTPEGAVCDIFMNGNSIGYYAVRALCTAYDVPMPELVVTCDEEREINFAIGNTKENTYAISLMGPAA